MALITCPECGREISDRVTACPHCGYPIAAPQQGAPQQVEVTSINISPKNPQKTKKLIAIVAAVVCLAIIIAVGAAVVKKKSDEKAAREAEIAAIEAGNEYIGNLVAARSAMLVGAASAEDLCILTHDVWYNTIYEISDSTTDRYTRAFGAFRDDFNDSIQFLYGTSETQDTISKIEDNRDLVDQLIKNLQNPTEEFSSCYSTIDSLYDAYCGLTNLAISPSGSLTSYSENYRKYDDDFIKYYDKLETQIPDIKEVPTE